MSEGVGARFTSRRRPARMVGLSANAADAMGIETAPSRIKVGSGGKLRLRPAESRSLSEERLGDLREIDDTGRSPPRRHWCRK